MLSDIFPIHPTSTDATDRPAPSSTVRAREALCRLPCGVRTRARLESREDEGSESCCEIRVLEHARIDSDVFGLFRGSLSTSELPSVTRPMSDFYSKHMSFSSSSSQELLRGLLSGFTKGLEVPFRFSLAFSSAFTSEAPQEVCFARGESGRRFVVKPLSRALRCAFPSAGFEGFKSFVRAFRRTLRALAPLVRASAGFDRLRRTSGRFLRFLLGALLAASLSLALSSRNS